MIFLTQQRFSWKSCYNWFPVSLFLISLDQLCKSWILSSLPYRAYAELFPGVFLTQVFNEGVAFSLFADGHYRTWLAIVLLTVVLNAGLFLAVGYTKLYGRLYGASVCLLLAGGVSNMIDRVCYGAVVDYITLIFQGYYWPTIFNLADVYVTFGTLMLFYWSSQTSLLRAQQSPVDEDVVSSSC